jgi:CheY-like chemotaxis protein
MGAGVSVQKQKILVVDDDAEVLNVSAVIVADLGYSHVCASDARDALKIIETDPSIDILITDIQMPAMHGFELARRAKALRADLKVVYVTGHPSPIPNRPVETFGPIVRKPFGWRDLARHLGWSSGEPQDRG